MNARLSVTLPSAAEVIGHRGALLRFARRKIRDEALAEDAVQEALTAALISLPSFSGQSALKTWLIGILNHKIQDVFRRESRYVALDEPGIGGDDDSPAPSRELVDDRIDPMNAAANRQMHVALDQAIDRLPETLRDVFRMQALEGVDTPEVCRRLEITEANCWVRLHRARKHLATELSNYLD